MKRRIRRHVVSALFLSAFLLAFAPSALASQTADQCDATPKYWCTHVIYTGTTLHERDFLGARDGGAQKWRLYYINDYYWNGSGWTWNSIYGPGAWHTNIAFDFWRCYCGDEYLPNGGRVQMQLEYYECTDGCYTWKSSEMNHYFS